MKATFGIVKRAWIRTPGQPIGKPGLGRISCPCGGAPETAFHPDQGNVTCTCGIVYTWDGFIVKAAPEPTICHLCGSAYDDRPFLCEKCNSNAFLRPLTAAAPTEFVTNRQHETEATP